MRRLILFIVIIFVVLSCSPSAQEQAVLNYEQTVDGTKTDLSMDIISLEKTGLIKFSDSLVTYKELFALEVDETTLKYDTRIYEYKRKVVDAMYSLATARLPQSVKHWRETIDLYESLAKADSLRNQKIKSGDYSNSELEGKYKLLKRYESSPDSLIADKYICSYSIKNPMLNGVKQELTKEYWISPSNKIVHSIKKTD